MDEYLIKERTGWGDGYGLSGNGNPFINLFQHSEAISNGNTINFPTPFFINSSYDTNLIYGYDEL